MIKKNFTIWTCDALHDTIARYKTTTVSSPPPPSSVSSPPDSNSLISHNLNKLHTISKNMFTTLHCEKCCLEL